MESSNLKPLCGRTDPFQESSFLGTAVTRRNMAQGRNRIVASFMRVGIHMVDGWYTIP